LEKIIYDASILQNFRRAGREERLVGSGLRWSPAPPLKGFSQLTSRCIGVAPCPRVRITLHFSQMNLKYNYENYLDFTNKARLIAKKFT
jgi:hypothetical protein